VAFTPRRVGVLAADGCLAAGLYQDALERRGVTAIVCELAAQAAFMSLLYQIKAGEVGEQSRAQMRRLAEGLVAAGAEIVLAGCTEIPLALGQGDIVTPLVDSIDALARKTVAIALA